MSRGEVARGMSGGTCPGGGGRSTCIINIVGNSDYKCYHEFAVKRSFPDETLLRSPSTELQKVKYANLNMSQADRS